jgi:hypothetical protein
MFPVSRLQSAQTFSISACQFPAPYAAFSDVTSVLAQFGSPIVLATNVPSGMMLHVNSSESPCAAPPLFLAVCAGSQWIACCWARGRSWAVPRSQSIACRCSPGRSWVTARALLTYSSPGSSPDSEIAPAPADRPLLPRKSVADVPSALTSTNCAMHCVAKTDSTSAPLKPLTRGAFLVFARAPLGFVVSKPLTIVPRTPKRTMARRTKMAGMLQECPG